MDSTEFLKFVEQNETAINITTYMDHETNKLLRWAVNRMLEGQRTRWGIKEWAMKIHFWKISLRACTKKGNCMKWLRTQV